MMYIGLMQAVTVAIPVHAITDWPTFHDVFQRVLGFPAFYGRNMDAWIDCLTSADSPDDGMVRITAPPGGLLILSIDDALNFRKRCPEQYEALVECSAFVNFQRTEIGETPILALLLNGKS